MSRFGGTPAQLARFPHEEAACLEIPPRRSSLITPSATMEGPASRVLQEGDADWKEIASYHLEAPVRFNVGAPHLCHPKQKPGSLSRAADSLLPVEFMLNVRLRELESIELPAGQLLGDKSLCQ